RADDAPARAGGVGAQNSDRSAHGTAGGECARARIKHISVQGTKRDGADGKGWELVGQRFPATAGCSAGIAPDASANGAGIKNVGIGRMSGQRISCARYRIATEGEVLPAVGRTWSLLDPIGNADDGDRKQPSIFQGLT